MGLEGGFHRMNPTALMWLAVSVKAQKKVSKGAGGVRKGKKKASW